MVRRNVKNIKNVTAASFSIMFSIAALSSCRAKSDERDLEALAREIHGRVLTVDTHCDTVFNLLRKGWKIGDRHDPALRGSGKIDLPRMAEGGLDAEFFAVFVGQGPRTPEGNVMAREEALVGLEAIHKMGRDYHRLVGLAFSPGDAYRLKKEGRRAAFIGMENGYPVGRDLALLKTYYNRGVRYLTLCHSRDNDICDSSTDRDDLRDNGLSDFGRQVVLECNRLGILVDVSHASDRSFADVVKAARAPVMASHSCCRALCDNPRNLSDDMLRALAANGGVIQICFLSNYVKKPRQDPERDQAMKELESKYGKFREIKDEAVREKARPEYEAVMQKYPQDKANIKDLVDHIDHVSKVAGVDHVGIGTDFDGGGGVIGCDDVSGMIHVTEELIRRGYSEKDIAKIWGENFMRVFRKAIEVSNRLNAK
jgi:membrane dipeptidase